MPAVSSPSHPPTHHRPFSDSSYLYPDGAGLACGVFEHLLSLGDDRPKVLAATHFHEIFENGFLPPRPGLAFGHMEVRVGTQAEAVEDQVTYLYKYAPFLGLLTRRSLTALVSARGAVHPASAPCAYSDVSPLRSTAY